MAVFVPPDPPWRRSIFLWLTPNLPGCVFPAASIGLWRARTIVSALLAAATLAYTPRRYTRIA